MGRDEAFLSPSFKKERNLKLFREYQDGASLAILVRRYGLAKSRVLAIVGKVAKALGERRRASRGGVQRPARGKQPRCRHCEYAYANRPRGLCWHCYYTPGLRDQYPSESKFAPKLHEELVPLLPAVAAYPDKRRMRRCPHDLFDGTCPQCEREQRRSVLVTEEDDDCTSDES